MARDLAVDLLAIREWGADAIVTLVEEQEMADLGVVELGSAIQKLGIAWHHFPILDLHAPPELKKWDVISPMLHQLLDGDGRVLVHCRGGLGRAGTNAALVLVERGDDAKTAMGQVGLILDARLNYRRAPGLTCLFALRGVKHFGDITSNDSKGCGTIMRVAPVG